MFYLKLPAREWLSTAWYPGYAEGLPDLLVGKMPSDLVADGWKVWIVETPAEREQLLATLDQPITIDGGSIQFAYDPHATINASDHHRRFPENIRALYPPPKDSDGDWPWISMYRFTSVEAAKPYRRGLMRGIYLLDFDRNEVAARATIDLHGAADKMAGLTSKLIRSNSRSAN